MCGWYDPGMKILLLSLLLSQSKANDIAVDKLPAEVKSVLEAYVKLLRDAADVDAAAKGFTEIAGGSLVDDSGKALRANVAQFSLKKDHGNIKFYADPVATTRVNASA